MTEANTMRINVSALQDLPIQARNISLKLVKIISDKAKSDPDKIPPIFVGKVNNLFYPINDHETLLGLRKSNVSQVEALVIDYPTMKDLVVAHVRKNLHPHGIDPLKIRQVIGYLAEDGVSESEICKMLWLDKRPELYETLRYEITNDAKKVFSEMVEEMSHKMYFIVIPIYYIVRLSKITKSEQGEAALEIKAYTMSKTSSDERFSWLSVDAVQSMLKSFHKEKKISPTKDRIAKYEDEEPKSKKKSTKKPIDPKTLKKAEAYIGKNPNLIYIPIKGNQPDLVFNKKSGTMSVANEKDGIYSLTGDKGKPTFVLADHVIKFLDIYNNDPIYVHKYDTCEKAQKALAKAEKPQKCVILSPVKLPRG